MEPLRAARGACQEGSGGAVAGLETGCGCWAVLGLGCAAQVGVRRRGGAGRDSDMMMRTEADGHEYGEDKVEAEQLRRAAPGQAAGGLLLLAQVCLHRGWFRFRQL